MTVLKRVILFSILFATPFCNAGGYEPFMGNSVVIEQYDRYFDGYVAGIAYNFVYADYRSKTTNLFDPTTPPPLHQEKTGHLDAIDVFVGYGQQLNHLFYLGFRGGAQLYTDSNIDIFRNPPPGLPDINLKDKFRARQSGYIDLIPGLVIEDRIMIYPLVGFSNTKYVYQGSILEEGERPLEYRNELKWGKAYRFGIGVKFAFFKALSMDLKVVHQAPYHVTWPATGAVSLTDNPPLDPSKHGLQPDANILSIGFEGYIN